MVPQQTDDHSQVATRADRNALITRQVHAPAAAIWSVLADGWMYATWVVGASRIRGVEPGWPNPGSRVHHSFGVWPAVIDDHTEVLTSDPGHELLLKARGWPAGQAHVRIQVTPDNSTVSITDRRCRPGR